MFRVKIRNDAESGPMPPIMTKLHLKLKGYQGERSELGRGYAQRVAHTRECIAVIGIERRVPSPIRRGRGKLQENVTIITLSDAESIPSDRIRTQMLQQARMWCRPAKEYMDDSQHTTNVD